MSSRARIHQTENGHELRCPTCGATVVIVAPLPLEDYLREIRDFAAAHEHSAEERMIQLETALLDCYDAAQNARGSCTPTGSAWNGKTMRYDGERVAMRATSEEFLRGHDAGAVAAAAKVRKVITDAGLKVRGAEERNWDAGRYPLGPKVLGQCDCGRPYGSHVADCPAHPEYAAALVEAGASRCDLPPSTYGPCELPRGHSGGLCRARVGTMEEVQWPSRPAEKSTEGDPELLARARRRMYAVHNHGPDEGPGLACRETLIGDCLRDNREELHKCVREGYGLFHREQAPGTVGERWCRWAQTLGWPSLSARKEGR